MNLLKLSYTPVNLKEFVSFWSSFYSYPLEELYTSRINKKRFSEKDLIELFKWKNGSNLSSKKQKALQVIIHRLGVINELKTDFCLETFLKEFKFVNGVIWKIYLLHIIVPDKYPIFDQHVCRAYCLLAKNHRAEIPVDNKKKEKLYFSEYVDFFNKLSEENVSRKKLDEALWAYGKFLKTQYGKKIW